MKTMYLALFALMFSQVAARENPFLPNGMDELNSTNIISKAPDFSEISMNLPSDARELVRVTLHYKSLDGSIRSKNVEIGSSIDWHDTLTLSKQVAPQNDKNILDISVTSKEPGSTTKSSANPAALNESSAPQVSAISAPALEPVIESVQFGELLKIDVFSNKITLVTADMLLKSYDDGSRIIIDFKKTSADMLTKSKVLNKGVLKKVVVGSHDKFYRVVLQLDKKYKYSIRQNSASYSIWLGK